MEARRRYMAVQDPALIDLTSNDYLLLSRHPALREAAIQALENGLPLGATGSRLLSGTHPVHEALEAKAAAFFGTPCALYFTSGFAAGYALTSTLPVRGDAIIYDTSIHACMRRGIQASPAKAYRAAHNDLGSFAEACARARARGAKGLWIVVESVYSMQGDLAPLRQLQALVMQYEAMLIVDEAHATGVFGSRGQGLMERTADTIITLHTCGKALGIAGGLVCATRTIVDRLINHASSFMYTTAAPPLQALLVDRALDIMAQEQWRREALLDLRKVACGILSPSPSAIFPYSVENDVAALAMEAYLRTAGFAVRAIRPPTVPRACLRIALNIGVGYKDLERLGEALKAVDV